jgi:antitoxin component HigA of HigAB toxin-antitoxin module
MIRKSGKSHDCSIRRIRTRNELANTDYICAPTSGITSRSSTLASKDNPTRAAGKYAEVLMTLIEAYEEEHHPIPDAFPVEVLRTLMGRNNLRQEDLVPGLWALKAS